MTKINLFCLPFAGGSLYSYRGYIENAPEHVNVVPLDLPGRGTRVRETLLTNIHDMVNDIYGQIKNRLNEPYAIYGHSMGSLIGYLLTKKIIKNGQNAPEYLILTGCIGPSLAEFNHDVPKHDLPKPEFIQKLKELGGSPDEVLENEQLLNFFEAIIRADFQATENYRYEESEPLNVPILVIIGLEERATYEQALAWQKETTEPIEVIQMTGKHFFIFDHVVEIMDIISKRLKQLSHYERSAKIS
ncbi:MAG: thioesterase II family protein [Bacteroidota bacterium]